MGNDMKYSNWLIYSALPENKDISLSYNFDKKLLDKVKMQNCKVFVSGKNLFTNTNWDGWDPETGQGVQSTNSFPVMKSVSVGLEVVF